VSQRRLSDAWVAAAILLALLGVIVLGVLLSPKKAALPALSSHSAQKDGSQALYAWLAQLGYRVSNHPESVFAVPAQTKAVFLLEPDPNLPLQSNEWQALDRFVQDGGILVCAGDGAGSASVARHYGFSTQPAGYNHSVAAFTPVLRSPPLDTARKIPLSENYLERAEFDYLPVLVADQHVYAASLPKGQGQVILVADSALFNNAGLKQAGAAELLLNLLAPIPRGTAIWFDEWHHGERTLETTRSGLEDWLVYTPTGQAVLWVLLVVFVGLVLQGRYFGRPLAAQKDVDRRAPLEYVNALARLSQRAGHRSEILSGYYRQLKRSLSQRYRIDPNLPDPEIARKLAETHPEMDAAALADLLKQLKRSNLSEQEMVERAHQAAEMIQKIGQSASGSADRNRE
jgi:hypothetical protein